jgi:hypothetical protein
LRLMKIRLWGYLVVESLSQNMVEVSQATVCGFSFDVRIYRVYN